MTIREGDYARLGATISKDEVTFTFAGEKEDVCYVVLVNAKGEESQVFVENRFCLGSLRSVTIAGADIDSYYYLINGAKTLDPYAKVIGGREIWNDLNRKEKNFAITNRLMTQSFDWEEDDYPEIPKARMVMYKLHVRGFSMDHGAKGKLCGTFGAIVQKLDDLKALGVTTIELMPCYEFEEIVYPVKEEIPEYITWKEAAEDLITKEQEEVPCKLNYWGYGKGDYFAVKESYAKNPGQAAFEFKTLVKEAHKRNMEIVMEMFFDEKVNHNLIIDCLRYWVREYHIDGFHLLGDCLPMIALAQDVMLSRTKLFFVDLDASILSSKRRYENLYVYKEEYQYPIRKILNHISGDMVEFANQQRKQGEHNGFVNFIASNNGFSLMDIFMYNDRHNEDNGENNEDGNPWNFSSNYGVEGPTRKKFVTASRNRQWRNAMLCLFLAQGVPLIWSGDEMQNSQKGNNNAYCQDNAIGWLNWKNAKTNASCISFVAGLAKFRREHPILAQETPFHFNDYKNMGFPDLSYHGENAWLSGLDVGRMSIGLMYAGAYDEASHEDLYIGYNFFSSVASLALPKLPKKKKWYLVIDSNRDEDAILVEPEEIKNQNVLSMGPQSICVLLGK